MRYLDPMHFSKFSWNLINQKVSLPASQLWNSFLWGSRVCLARLLPAFLCWLCVPLPPSSRCSTLVSSLSLTHTRLVLVSRSLCLFCPLPHVPSPSLFLILQTSINISLQNCFPDCLPRGTHPTPFPVTLHAWGWLAFYRMVNILVFAALVVSVTVTHHFYPHRKVTTDHRWMSGRGHVSVKPYSWVLTLEFPIISHVTKNSFDFFPPKHLKT